MRILRYVADKLGLLQRRYRYHAIYRQMRTYTMIRPAIYAGNLAIAEAFSSVPGCVVECGTWKGGMIAGIAKLLGSDRHYYLFDSFEGLPDPKAIDGQAAAAWQTNTTGAWYFDNCTASEESARAAMQLSQAGRVSIIKG